jgi:hypothetical protein
MYIYIYQFFVFIISALHEVIVGRLLIFPKEFSLGDGIPRHAARQSLWARTSASHVARSGAGARRISVGDIYVAQSCDGWIGNWLNRKKKGKKHNKAEIRHGNLRFWQKIGGSQSVGSWQLQLPMPILYLEAQGGLITLGLDLFLLTLPLHFCSYLYMYIVYTCIHAYMHAWILSSYAYVIYWRFTFIHYIYTHYIYISYICTHTHVDDLCELYVYIYICVHDVYM